MRPLQVDEDRLAGRHVAHQRWPVPSSATDSLATITSRPPSAVSPRQTQRADAERVAEGQQAVAGDQRDHRVRALDAPVHRGHGLEHLLGRQRQVARHQLQLVRQHVDQHLGVALGVDVAAVDVEQLLPSAPARW
jgi:hypothetical protein